MAVDSNVLTAVIGLPAAMVTAVGTVWTMGRLRSKPVASNGRPPEDHVTSAELRSAVRDLRRDLHGEIDTLRTDMNGKLDLIVKLVVKNGGAP